MPAESPLSASGNDDLRLIETMRCAAGSGRCFLLALHMERLRHSAAALGFACDMTRVRQVLRDRLRTLDAAESALWRVRLLLSRDGEIAITATPMPHPRPRRPWPVVIAPRRVSGADSLLRHKTTRRAIFDAALSYARERGAREALLLNERDELTEGAFTSVFLLRDGRLLTPPLSCGLLPGTLRAALLRKGWAEEAVLTPDDLCGGCLFVGNSVRGLAPARLLE